jgi:hypothetical protein
MDFDRQAREVKAARTAVIADREFKRRCAAIGANANRVDEALGEIAEAECSPSDRWTYSRPPSGRLASVPRLVRRKARNEAQRDV